MWRRAGARAASREVVIETSTLPIAVKEEARLRLAAARTTLLDCPISGTGAQARTGDVIVYASGPKRDCLAVGPVLSGFSRAHYYVGPFGAGSKTKFVANLLVAIHNVAAAEGLVLAMKAGLDPALTLKVIADGAGGSRMLQLRGPMMVRGDYRQRGDAGDVREGRSIIADFARQAGSPDAAPGRDGSRLHGGRRDGVSRRTRLPSARHWNSWPATGENAPGEGRANRTVD